MGTVILETLDLYLIPTLAHIVLGYLTATYTLEMKYEDFPSDMRDPVFYLQCEISPLLNKVRVTYSAVLSEITSLDKLPPGWSQKELPDFDDQSPCWLVTKTFKSSLDTLSVRLDETIKEDPSPHLFSGTWVSFSTNKQAEKYFYLGQKSFVTSLKKFINKLSDASIEVDGYSLWCDIVIGPTRSDSS